MSFPVQGQLREEHPLSSCDLIGAISENGHSSLRTRDPE